jgi:hypothetical protein
VASVCYYKLYRLGQHSEATNAHKISYEFHYEHRPLFVAAFLLVDKAGEMFFDIPTSGLRDVMAAFLCCSVVFKGVVPRDGAKGE